MCLQLSMANITISIHALREEGDRRYRMHFDSNRISIHALREEGDSSARAKAPVPPNFYPRPPRGGRPVAEGHQVVDRVISIHALREEGDAGRGGAGTVFNVFLSTPSARRATRLGPDV